MYRHINIIVSIFASALISHSVCAQDISSVLRSVEQNNVGLQSLRQENEAAQLETKMQNNLGDPSVEYSPFWAKGTDGVASSELVVSYGFEFPTVYASRGKAGKLQRSALEQQYLVARRNVLLQAKDLCIDIISISRRLSLLERRLDNADAMMELFQTRFDNGDASAIELNKIKMERMETAAQVSRVKSELETARLSLQAMNGNFPVDFSIMEYPAGMPVPEFEAFRDSLLADELEIKASEAELQAAEQEIKVNNQNWLPELQVGYRRNTALRDASNGFIVGASFPIFSNRHKSRIAKARHTASRLQLDDARIQAESRIRAKYDEMLTLRQTIDAYDRNLMEETLDMLRRAVEAGQISVIEYYTEADSVYSSLLSLSETENQYHKLIADIYRNSL